MWIYEIKSRDDNLITISNRIFKFFDQDDDNVINFSEFVMGLAILCKGTQEEKIECSFFFSFFNFFWKIFSNFISENKIKWNENKKVAFKGYDLNGDGFITPIELYKMYKAYFFLSMELIRDVVRGFLHFLFFIFF